MEKSRVKHFLPTVSGAFNGMIADNLKHLESPVHYSLNFPETVQMKQVMTNFQRERPSLDVKFDFLKMQKESESLFTSFPVVEHLERGAHGNLKEQFWAEDDNKSK